MDNSLIEHNNSHMSLGGEDLFISECWCEEHTGRHFPAINSGLHFSEAVKCQANFLVPWTACPPGIVWSQLDSWISSRQAGILSTVVSPKKGKDY